MPADLHSEDTTLGSVADPMFSHLDSGVAGVPSHVLNLGIGSARDATSGPSGLFRYRVLKRAMDVILVLAVTPVLVPLLLLIAAAVRIGSPGPAFFSHRRIRGHGVFFTMWRFRTMCVNSAEVLENCLKDNPEARSEWHKTHMLQHDPRVTLVGAFLRKTGLDELPQLWNVLNGSMSLVGPRPIAAAEVERYGDCFPAYCMVKPGITGLWQVSDRSRTSDEVRIRLDKRYVHEWTLGRDVAILLKTFVCIMDQDGAY